MKSVKDNFINFLLAVSLGLLLVSFGYKIDKEINDYHKIKNIIINKDK